MEFYSSLFFFYILKIAINARLLRKDKLDGIGWVTFNILKLIVRNNPNVKFDFLFDSGVDKDFLFAENVDGINIFPPAKHAILNLAWFEIGVKRFLKKQKPDLFFSPDGILCLGWEGKQVGIIHDLNFLHRPKDLSFANRTYYNYFFPKYAQKAHKLMTVSEYSKQDIIKHYHITPDKIDVIKLGINSFFQKITARQIKDIRDEISKGKPYFLFVGTLHPRKNIINLLRAFEVFKTETNSELKLILAGQEMYKTGEMHYEHHSMRFRGDVIFTGRLSNEKLVRIYNGAFALTFVPFFEGFGLPLIEAMKCGIPIISSDTTSLPEVAQEAAIYVNPSNISEIKDAMIKLYTSPTLRQKLVEAGNIISHQYSWEKCASQVWNHLVSTM